MEGRSRLLTSMLQISFYLNFFNAYSGGNIEDNYIGCYYDDVNDLSQPQKTTLQNNTTLTIEWCVGQCLMRNATYAGLENSKECLCRDNLGAMLPDASCNSLCPGNPSEYCGGSNGQRVFYSLYTVCEIGDYGNTCDQVCHCRKRAPCDRMTGKCPNECDGKWFGGTCGDIHLSEKYIGCFRDNETRAISPDTPTDSNMTVEMCLMWCILRSNSIAGLQAGRHCSCGENYARYGELSDYICYYTCIGNQSQKCGGDWANSIYSVCPAGYYGPKCHNQCHCYNNGRCVYLTGECNATCEAGWSGNSCNIRDCMAEDGDCFKNETCATINLNFATITGCRCSPGYDRKAFWDICEDIDECGLGICDASSTDCINTVGGYNCTCMSGYRQLNETTCYDLDECALKIHKCSDATDECNNTIGSFSCICRKGFNRTNVVCEDIDECSLGFCDKQTTTCTNTMGSFICIYQDGYKTGNNRAVCEEFSCNYTIGIILGTLLAISLLIHALFACSRTKRTKAIKPEAGREMTQSDLHPCSVKSSDKRERNNDATQGLVDTNSVYEPIIPEHRRIIQNPNSEYAELKLDIYRNVESCI